MKKIVRSLIRYFGVDIVRYYPASGTNLPPLPDVSTNDLAILKQVVGRTMTSVERQATLVSAVRHLARAQIKGCLVECGVWRGGSSMVAALTLIEERQTDRQLYLFDTFQGMTVPTDADRSVYGVSAQELLDRDVSRTGVWCVADLADVQRGMKSTGYPIDHIHYVQGPVETTIPGQSPAEPIALLRLDTDWYESTRHELVHLFPRLVDGGILIVDDYGAWEGARKAVDEYLAELPRPLYLHRIDDTGRLLIKS